VPANTALKALDLPAQDVEIRGVVRGLMRQYARPAVSRAR